MKVIQEKILDQLFEVKQGPYQASSYKDFAATELLEWFRQCSAGQRAPVLV